MSDWFSFVAKKKDARPAVPKYNPKAAADTVDDHDGGETMQVEEHTGSETSIQRIIKSWTGKR